MFPAREVFSAAYNRLLIGNYQLIDRTDTVNVPDYMKTLGREARQASRAMARADTGAKNRALESIAAAIRRESAALVATNAEDLAAARANGLEAALLDRLTLSEKGVAAMADGVAQVAALADPVGEIDGLKFRPSGIQVGKMRVPLGVIGIIYESRPNVTADAAALCLKSGNAAILRGGSEALHCNQAIAECVRLGLAAAGQGGVHQAPQIPASETDRTLGQLGCNGLDELGPERLRR